MLKLFVFQIITKSELEDLLLSHHPTRWTKKGYGKEILCSLTKQNQFNEHIYLLSFIHWKCKYRLTAQKYFLNIAEKKLIRYVPEITTGQYQKGKKKTHSNLQSISSKPFLSRHVYFFSCESHELITCIYNFPDVNT